MGPTSQNIQARPLARDEPSRATPEQLCDALAACKDLQEDGGAVANARVRSPMKVIVLVVLVVLVVEAVRKVGIPRVLRDLAGQLKVARIDILRLT